MVDPYTVYSFNYRPALNAEFSLSNTPEKDVFCLIPENDHAVHMALDNAVKKRWVERKAKALAKARYAKSTSVSPRRLKAEGTWNHIRYYVRINP